MLLRQCSGTLGWWCLKRNGKKPRCAATPLADLVLMDLTCRKWMGLRPRAVRETGQKRGSRIAGGVSDRRCVQGNQGNIFTVGMNDLSPSPLKAWFKCWTLSPTRFSLESDSIADDPVHSHKPLMAIDRTVSWGRASLTLEQNQQVTDADGSVLIQVVTFE